MTEVEVGKVIPLALQVYDGDPDLEVNAILLERDGKVFSNAKLVHSFNGLYVNFSLPMPDLDLLIVQYQTNKPDEYELAVDTFKSKPKPMPVEKMMVGEVVSKGQWDDEDIIVGEAYVDEENESSE